MRHHRPGPGPDRDLATPDVLVVNQTRKGKGNGFEIETLINLRAAAAGLAITEVPSYEHARIHGESNLNTFRDGRRVLRTIITEWRSR